MHAQLIIYPSFTLRRNQRWRWRLVSAGKKIANGSEGYANRIECEAIARRIVSGAYHDNLTTVTRQGVLS